MLMLVKQKHLAGPAAGLSAWAWLAAQGAAPSCAWSRYNASGGRGGAGWWGRHNAYLLLAPGRNQYSRSRVWAAVAYQPIGWACVYCRVLHGVLHVS